MNFVTTMIVLAPHTAFNSMANSCLTLARDLLGGREVIIMNNAITAREFKASSHPLYITALKVISCILLIPFGVIFRLLSCYNPDVRRALSYTPETESSPKEQPTPAPKSSQGQESTQNPDKKVETPKTELSPKEEPTPAPKSSQEQKPTQNSGKKVEAPKIKPSPKEGPTAPPEKKSSVSGLGVKHKTSSKDLLSLINTGNCSLLYQFKDCEIEIVDASDVITLVKLSLLKNSSFLAEKLVNDQKYSNLIALEEINGDFLEVAIKARHQKTCAWILNKRPFLELNIKSGLPYLELICNSQDTQTREFLENPFKDKALSKTAEFYLDQLYIYIPHALLFSEGGLTKGLKTYEYHLKQFLNVSQKTDFLKVWIHKEEAILSVFEELGKRTITKPDAKSICSIHGNLLKHAFVYLEYLKLDTDGNKSEASKKLLEIYTRVLGQLEWVKVNAPTDVGKELFKKHVFPQLKSAISKCS